jgi:glycosyltransferase involved in cell wall biosynthesis
MTMQDTRSHDTSPRLRVAMVCGSADVRRDGVADYVRHLVTELGTVGVDVALITMTSVGGVARELRACRPDLVHLQFAPSAFGFSPAVGVLPLLLDRRVPLVTTVHEYGWWSALPWLPGWALRLLERNGWWDRETGRLIPASAATVVTNEVHAEAVRGRGTTPHVIPLAPNVTADAGHEPGQDVSHPLLAFFGYVHPVKGVRYLIEAVALLRDRHPGVRLAVVGGFTSLALPEPEARAFAAELAALACEHGVADRVEFTGYLPAEQATALLARADLGVLPFTEGVTTKSGALLTLLAHGLPTVVTVPDRPDPGLVDGWHVHAVRARRDGPALAEGIDTVLRDDSLRARLVLGAAEAAGGRDWSRVARDHRDLYRGLLRR